MKSAIQSVFERDRKGKLTGEIAKGAEWAVSFERDDIDMMLMPDGMLVRISKFGQLQKPVAIAIWRNDYVWIPVNINDNLRLYQEFTDLRISSNDIEGLYFFCGPSVNGNTFLLEEDSLIPVNSLTKYNHSSFFSISDLFSWYLPILRSNYGHGLMFIDALTGKMAKILNRDWYNIGEKQDDVYTFLTSIDGQNNCQKNTVIST